LLEPDFGGGRLPDVQPAYLPLTERPTVSPPPLQMMIEPTSTSFTAWYAQSRPTLARALALSIGDDDLAREAIDEAMTRAYASWSKVSTLDNPSGWVYRVAMNWSLSVFRRRRRPAPPGAPPTSDMPIPMDTSVTAALARLDVKHRSVVVCRYLFGWSEEQTAEALNIPAGTVKSRLSRATSQLRSQLAHLRPEDLR
jgi:DNA-directed RNA polymerase specialized sigma24 family protein